LLANYYYRDKQLYVRLYVIHMGEDRTEKLMKLMKNYLKRILIITVKIVQNGRYVHKFHYLHENFDQILH